MILFINLSRIERKSYLHPLVLLKLAILLLLCSPQSGYAANEPVYVAVDEELLGQYSLPALGDGQFCIAKAQLEEWGLSADILDNIDATARCLNNETFHANGIRLTFNPTVRLLQLVIKQADAAEVDNSDDPSQWDDGINAMFLNYDIDYEQYSGTQYREYQNRETLSAELSSGINLANWRFRYSTNYQRYFDEQPKWQKQMAFAETDIKSLRSRLIVGDGSTPDMLFESIPFSGVMLSSDSRMQPKSQRPLLMLVQGRALSNAEVRIRQDGQTIHRAFVPPGPFVFKNIQLLSSSGLIFMTIRESDGQTTMQQIPYSAVPGLTQKGQLEYTFAAGKYRIDEYDDEEQKITPQLQFASLAYGLPQNYTAYGGLLLADNFYRSAAFGVGKRFVYFGEAALDYQQAWARPIDSNETEYGSFYRLRYAKVFPDLNTSLNIVGRYFPAKRYHSLQDAIELRRVDEFDDFDDGYFDYEDEEEEPEEEEEEELFRSASARSSAPFLGGSVYSPQQTERDRYHLEAQLKVNLNATDNLYLTANHKTYRYSNRKLTSLSLNYTSSFKNIDYSLYGRYSKRSQQKEELFTSLNITIPLSKFGLSNARLGYTHSWPSTGKGTDNYSFSNSALEDSSLTYGANYSQSPEDNQFRGYASYDYSAGNWSLNYNQGKNFRKQSANINGSAMLHAGGITLGQTLGETMALVEVKNTPGIEIENQSNTKTDNRGFAIVGDITPYQNNSLGIDTLMSDIEIEDNEIDRIPTQGAIVYVSFPTPTAGKSSSMDDDEDENEESDDEDNSFELNDKAESSDGPTLTADPFTQLAEASPALPDSKKISADSEGHPSLQEYRHPVLGFSIPRSPKAIVWRPFVPRPIEKINPTIGPKIKPRKEQLITISEQSSISEGRKAELRRLYGRPKLGFMIDMPHLPEAKTAGNQ